MEGVADALAARVAAGVVESAVVAAAQRACEDEALVLDPATAAELAEAAEAMKLEGNVLFKDGAFREAISRYSDAIETCPRGFAESAAYFGNRAACHQKLDNHDSCIEDCTKALEVRPEYLKVLMRRAISEEETKKYQDALDDAKRVLELDPGNDWALKASRRLPGRIEQQTEELKQEMFGKLKELGNMCLKPFGLSTDNFQMVQDPATGGYSMNFKQ